MFHGKKREQGHPRLSEERALEESGRQGKGSIYRHGAEEDGRVHTTGIFLGIYSVKECFPKE